MSISSLTNRNNYTGNGATETYPYTFKVNDESHLKVTVRNTSGVETVLTLTTHYTVTGEGQSGGGNVVLVNGAFDWIDAEGDLKTGYILSIRRVVPLKQETDIRNQGSFLPETHENVFDYATMIDQQQQDELDRSIRLPETLDPADFDNEVPATFVGEANVVLMTNDDGDGWAVGPTADEISGAQASATAAEASATAAAASATAAAASATAADASADDAAAAATVAAEAAVAAAMATHEADTGTHGVATIAGLTEVQSFTNKSLVDNSVSFVNNGDATKKLRVELGGATTGTTLTLQSDHTGNRVVTIPDGTDTLVNTAGTQTLQNKTFPVFTLDGQASAPSAPSAGNYKVYVSDTTQKLTIKDSAGTETTVGSGAGGVNYIENPDAEGGTTGWTTYADADQSTPVDGTGGTPALVWARSTSSPLRGLGSFTLTHDDSTNNRGEGVSYDFEIDAADKSKILQLSFDYIVVTGTFVAGTSTTESDYTVWIYDVTNSRLIQPSTYKLFSNSTTISDRFITNFQTSADSTSYRLIIHRTTVATADCTMRFDNFIISPTTIAFGTPITDWQEYTPAFTGFGTVNTFEAWWRKVGSNMELDVTWTTGTTTAVEAQISLPNNASIAGVGGSPSMLGVLAKGEVISGYNTVLATPGDTFLNFGVTNGSVGNALVPQNGSSISGNTKNLSFYVSVPIAGWSSQVQTSDVSDQRIVSFRAHKNGGAVTANTTIASWTKDKDSHNAFNATSGEYTIPISGDYLVSGNFVRTGTGGFTRSVRVNGTIVGTNAAVADTGPFPTMVLEDLVAGDVVTLTVSGSVTATSTDVDNLWSISRIANPALISATETIALVVNDSTTAGTTSAPFVFTTVQRDTHNAYNEATGVYTVPSAGLYNINASVGGSLGSIGINIHINGTKTIEGTSSGSIVNYKVSALWPLVAGDTIEIRPSGNATADGDDTSNYLMIHRIGL